MTTGEDRGGAATPGSRDTWMRRCAFAWTIVLALISLAVCAALTRIGKPGDLDRELFGICAQVFTAGSFCIMAVLSLGAAREVARVVKQRAKDRGAWPAVGHGDGDVPALSGCPAGPHSHRAQQPSKRTSGRGPDLQS